MRITAALLGEHGAFYALFDQIEALAESAGAIDQIRSATTVLNAVIVSHATLEEELLFPALEPHLAGDGPLTVMRAEHKEIERALESVEDAQEVQDALDWIQHGLVIAREHFQKEELVLFPVAEKILDDETLTRLGQAWSEARHVRIG